MNEIERIEKPAVEVFYKNYILASKPVILTGVIDEWKAVLTWTIDYLRERVGHKEVNINVSETERFIGTKKEGFETLKTQMKFSEYMEYLEKKGGGYNKQYYLQQESLSESFPELKPDIEIPHYFDEKYLGYMGFWISGANKVSPLHYDVMDNLLAQIKGEKKLVLFAPEQIDLLYPFPIRSQIPHISQVDIERIDSTKFTKFAKAKSVECVLKAGEILFIPVLWWHQVYSQADLNISVNFWYKVKVRQLLLRVGGRRMIANYLLNIFKKLGK